MRWGWLLFALACLMTAPAWAQTATPHDEFHQFYQGLVNSKGARCCGGRDCRPVTGDALRGNPQTGFDILDPATKRWLPVPEHAILIDARSPDGRLHACIWGGEVRCVILPGML